MADVSSLPGVVERVVGGVRLTLCRDHEREECHVCCMSFTDVNEEARTTHEGEKHCNLSSCGRQGGASLKICGGCRNAWYCNRNCQRANWTEHKAACRAMGTMLQIEEGKPPVRRFAPGTKLRVKMEGMEPVKCSIVKFLPGRGPYQDPMVSIDLQKYPQYRKFDDWCRYSIRFPSGDVQFDTCESVHDENAYILDQEE